MMFAAGGILYRAFKDIAPETHEGRAWTPALGAVLGFALALAGDMILRVSCADSACPECRLRAFRCSTKS